MNLSCLALAVSVLFIPNYSAKRTCKARKRTRTLKEQTKSTKSSKAESTSKNGARSRNNRKLPQADHTPYDHDVINVYNSMEPWHVIDKLNDAANGDTVLFEPGDYVINSKICPFTENAHPSYTIKGTGESPSDTVIYAAEFACANNHIVIENIEIWGSLGTTCSNELSYDNDAGLIFRNSIVKVFGKPFELLIHKVHFINSEFINLIPHSSDGLIENDRYPLVAMNSKFVGFDRAIVFDNDTPLSSKFVKISKNSFEDNCGNCEYLAGNVTSECSEITSSLSPNTPKGNNIEIYDNIIDILRYLRWDERSPPIYYILFKKVVKAGETTVYRIPNGYSMIQYPSGFYPVYTDAAHAYQFDTTARYRKRVYISFKREEVFGLDCETVEFFFYKDGMTAWQSLAGVTYTSPRQYDINIAKKKASLDGLIIAAFVPEGDCVAPD